jgi:outer membrane protein TolC
MIRTLTRSTPRIPGLAPLAGLALAAAAAGAAEPLTPQDAVALALANHPAVEAADRALARSGYRPRIDLAWDLMRSTDPVFAFGSKLRQERFGLDDFGLDALNDPDALTNAATTVELRQNLWDAGRTTLGRRAAGAGFDAVRAARGRTRDEIAFRATRTFWDAVLADDTVGVLRDARAAARANRDIAARLLEEGLVVPSDVLSAEVRLSELEAALIRAEQHVRTSRAALVEALGVGAHETFLLRPPEVAPRAPDGTLDHRVAEALVARGDLRAIDARIRQARVGERIARSHRLPEVGLGAAYRLDDDAPFGADGSSWSVGLALRVPLFDGLETRARLARARADRARLESQRRRLVEGIRLEVTGAWAAGAAAARRLEVAEGALASAEEALRIVRDRYEEGMAVVVELLGAESALTAARGTRVAAASELALAGAALDLATGRAPTPRLSAEDSL